MRGTRGWSAAEVADEETGVRTLCVQGEAHAFASNERVTLRRLAGSDASDGVLQLELVLAQRGGGEVPHWVKVEFKLTVMAGQFCRVVLSSVEFAGAELKVKAE